MATKHPMLKPNGYSQSEILVALLVLGLISALSVTVLVGNNDASLDTSLTQRLSLENSILKGVSNARVQSGLIPRTMKPHMLLRGQLKTVPGEKITLASNLPDSCQNVALPAQVLNVIDSPWQIIVGEDWETQANRNDLSRICIHHSKKRDVDKTLVVYREGDGVRNLANAGASQNTVGVAVTAANTTNSLLSTGPMGINGSTTPDSFAPPPSIPPSTPPSGSPPSSGPPASPSPTYQKIGWASREKSRNMAKYNYFDNLGKFFKNFNAGQKLNGGYANIHLFDQNFKLMQVLNIGTMIPTMKIDMGDIPAERLQQIGWTKGTKDLGFYEARDLGAKLGYGNCALGSGDVYSNINCVMGKYVQSNSQGEIKKDASGNAITAGNAQRVLWTDPITKIIYELAAGYSVFSPVKIALDEKDAVTSSEGAFEFDVDGFSIPTFPVFKTTGGLNDNEAWLAYDRKSNGFFNAKRVLDGDDIFGDHLGRYTSGYEDLADTFENDIEADEAHKRYIPLHELNWFESFWIWLTRLFGFNTDPIASYDLQLIKSSNDVVPAASVLTRVYVDYVNTEEFDKTGNNAILQRALVVYKSGKTAQSGDLWFRPQMQLFATPVGDANDTQSKGQNE